ncbi:MAG: hypothetical protein IPQ07_20570 [Myxococcales bacterium]|nr:hypothetical protein [Myxococcales bacterium]
MRVLLFVTFAALLAVPPLARASDGEDQQTINAKDLRKYFEPYIPAVKECYAPASSGREARGVLRLELTIHRDGTVVQFGFKAPGVVGAALSRLDGCLRNLSTTWHFPPRRGFTMAIIPLQFVRTVSPGAGPKVSKP